MSLSAGPEGWWVMADLHFSSPPRGCQLQGLLCAPPSCRGHPKAACQAARQKQDPTFPCFAPSLGIQLERRRKYSWLPLSKACPGRLRGASSMEIGGRSAAQPRLSKERSRARSQPPGGTAESPRETEAASGERRGWHPSSGLAGLLQWPEPCS